MIATLPTHPSLILYSAISQAYFFDDSKYLDIRHKLNSYIKSNVREVGPMVDDILSPKEQINF